MPLDLVVNPYLQVLAAGGEDHGFRLFAPKPGYGLKTLNISPDENPRLFDLLSELVNTRLLALNPEIDLDESERDLLVEHGILVLKNAQPDQPLFQCSIDDILPFDGDFKPGELIVDPTFRFAAFDLSKFSYLARERRLSPFLPSIWTRCPVNGIEYGYWVSHEDAVIVSRLVAGESPGFEISDSLIRKLISAEIVGHPIFFAEKIRKEKIDISEANLEFARQKYTALSSLFPATQMQAMRRYYASCVANGFMPFGDVQVAGRYCEHNELFAAYVHAHLLEMMTAVVGKKVKLAYVYAASYQGGSILNPHTDREQCEYSISFQVDYQPLNEDFRSQWPIYLEPLEDYNDEINENGVTIDWAEVEKVNSRRATTPIYLRGGDALIYKGRELIHYRYALPETHSSTSLFFHFVADDFGGNIN